MTTRAGARPVVAITGASGFLGSRLVERYQRAGCEVRALLRRTDLYPFAEQGIRTFRCDLPDDIDDAALAGADVVVHCAYTTRFTDLEAARRVNDAGTREVLRLSRAAGAGQFVFISSQSSHEEARSYYGRSKLALEKLLDPARDLILRPGLIIDGEGEGLFHRMVETVKKSRVIPVFGGGRQPLQTIHRDDLCAAIEHGVAARRSGLFTVAHPDPITVGEFLRSIARHAGRKPLFVPFPITPALLALRAIEALRIPFPVSSENLLGLKQLRADDTRRDLVELGISPRSTEECLREVFAAGARDA